MKSLLLLSLFSLTVLSSAATPAEQIHQAETWLAGRDRPGTPGGVAGVWQDGHWLVRRGFGVADLATGRPNTPDLVFGVASVSKQFTAAAAVIAAEKGFFSLEDDIRKYLPELPDYGRPIRIQDLAHHVSGLRDDGTLVKLTGRPDLYTSQQDLVRLFARQQATNFPPGERYLYSNAAYVLLSEIIERRTGLSLARFAEENIFRPLGMKDTYYAAGGTASGQPGANAYSFVRGQWVESGGFDPARRGAGGIKTTLDDYARWVANLLADESKLVGGPALTRRLREPVTLTTGAISRYGFGLDLEPYRGVETVRHGGSGGGFKAAVMFFPQQKLGVFVFCNNGEYAQSIALALADIFLVTSGEGGPARKEPVVPLPREALEALAGTYREPSLGLPMIVKANERGLWIEGDALPYQFEPLSATRFRTPENITIEFDLGADGHAVRLRQVEVRKYGTTRFERTAFVQPSPAELASYTGLYRSEELDAVYRLQVVDGRLIAEPQRPAEVAAKRALEPYVFAPTVADEFASIADRIVLRFDRAAGGNVTGFRLNAQYGWVTGVRFTRLPVAP